MNDQHDMAISTIMAALSLLMHNNYFKFGDTCYRQITGTVLGALPTCTCAIICFGAHKRTTMPLFAQNLGFYKRCIDDCFDIWLYNTGLELDQLQWQDFQQKMNSCSKLHWEFTKLAQYTPFLDLFISIDEQHKTQALLCEKPMNLCLHFPPCSNHPSGIFKGFLKGMIHCIVQLMTDVNKQKHDMKNLHRCLCLQGHSPTWLQQFLQVECNNTHKKALQPAPTWTYFDHTLKDTEPDKLLFLHLSHSCNGPKSWQIQEAFHSTVLCPQGKPHFSELHNKNNVKIQLNKLTIVHSGRPNLCNLMFTG